VGSLVRWGVLGAARIARQQVVPAIRRSGSGEVLAVSSASGRASSFAADLGIARAYDSHDELLADPDVDAVYVALPNASHAEWIVRAAAAGKHILCEKPLVLGTAELDRVEQACRSAEVQLVEAFMYRHHPQVPRVRELLADNTVGELVMARAHFHFTLERSDEPDIRLRPDLGGGSLYDIGCYPVDLFGCLLGDEPQQVAAVASRKDDGAVDTRLAAILRYGDVLATFDCSFDAPFVNAATLVGTRGTVTMTDAFRTDRTGGVGRVILERDGVEEALELRGDNYGEQVRTFSRRVLSGIDSSDEEALTRRTVRTVERVARAAGLV
jgi:D-xylose 1-dehydrogenase (NADP+, D-xylono-1,5-lactone-forming)